MVNPNDIPLYPSGVPKHIDYPDIPLYQFLNDSAREFPTLNAVILETKNFNKIAKLTFSELGEQTDKFAAFLADKGISG